MLKKRYELLHGAIHERGKGPFILYLKKMMMMMIIISGIGEEKFIDLQLEHICGHKSIKELDEEQSPATLVM
ncbi:MAG: hypothetical protein M3114_00115 [Thermoproteota archaeon]|nr:hypothetical protein [Thermoproteota archaeon]